MPNDYIIEPLDTDPSVIFDNFKAFIQQTHPDWNPNEAQLDAMFGRYWAMQVAYTADMASRVQRAIFRYFGSSLAGIPPLPGSNASGVVAFNVIVPEDPADQIDRTLPFGTLVGITDQDGDVQMFSLIDDMVVLAGVATGSANVLALEVGTAGNALTGTVQMIELVDWIESATVSGATSGGSDPEEDEVYIQRLTDNLALMAPRPIVAEDFALFAQNIPGVWRAAVIGNFGGGALEVQRIHSDRTGGNYTLAFRGSASSANVPWNSTAEQVRAALASLTTLDDTDIVVTGGPLPGTDINITFRGRYAYADQPLLTFNAAGLTGGTTFAITQITAGAIYNTTTENAIAISAIDESGMPLPADVKQQLIDYLQATRAQNFVITFVDPAYHTIDIDYDAVTYAGWDAASVQSSADQNLTDALAPDRYGTLAYRSGNRDWVVQPIVRYLDLTTLVENTPGLDYTSSLTFGLDGGALSGADKSFLGANGNNPFSLTQIGTITGSVTNP